MRGICRVAALAVLIATTSLCAQTGTPGDADGNGTVNVSDVLYLINYLFAGGPAPLPPDGTILLPGGVPLAMALVPAGSFQMGSPEAERGRGTDEQLHSVTLTQDYYMGVFAVTQAQWTAVMGTPMPSSCGAYGVGPSYPVYCVSWEAVAGAGGFIETLNQYLADTNQPGAGSFRLPTEAEWEYAARGGTQTRFSFGDALNCADDCTACATAAPQLVWCGDKQADLADPVGQKLPNAYGLYDMHGGAWQFVNDWYGAYSPAPQTDPTGPATGSVRAIRGGSWQHVLKLCRSAQRLNFPPTMGYYFIGFRLARSL